MMESRHRRLVIVGPPGAGKGTQGKLLSDALGLRHIASGDIVRQHQSNETDLGLLSRAYYSKGLMVPDEITNSMVMPEVLAASEGFILDGFPRNVSQAERLDDALAAEGLQIDVTLLITASREETMTRLANRQVCPNCKRVYSPRSVPPLKSNLCDDCGTTLMKREDDNPEALSIRMDEYQARTLPLVKFYRAQGKLLDVSGSGDIQTVLHRILQGLEIVTAAATLASTCHNEQPNPGWSFKKRHV